MWFKWVLVSVLVLGALTTVHAAAREKRGDKAIVSIILNGLLLAGILYYWQ